MGGEVQSGTQRKRQGLDWVWPSIERCLHLLLAEASPRGAGSPAPRLGLLGHGRPLAFSRTVSSDLWRRWAFNTRYMEERAFNTSISNVWKKLVCFLLSTDKIEYMFQNIVVK